MKNVIEEFDNGINIKFRNLLELMLLHDISVKEVYDIVCNGIKSTISMTLPLMMQSIEYPVKIRINKDMVLIVNKDGSKDLQPYDFNSDEDNSKHIEKDKKRTLLLIPENKQSEYISLKVEMTDETFEDIKKLLKETKHIVQNIE